MGSQSLTQQNVCVRARAHVHTHTITTIYSYYKEEKTQQVSLLSEEEFSTLTLRVFLGFK